MTKQSTTATEKSVKTSNEKQKSNLREDLMMRSQKLLSLKALPCTFFLLFIVFIICYFSFLHFIFMYNTYFFSDRLNLLKVFKLNLFCFTVLISLRVIVMVFGIKIFASVRGITNINFCVHVSLKNELNWTRLPCKINVP